MSLINNYGDICNIVFESSYRKDILKFDWIIIDDFGIYLKQKCDSYFSPSFQFRNAQWCCQIFPNGRKYTSNYSMGFVSVSFDQEKSFTLERCYDCRFSLSMFCGESFLLKKTTEATLDAAKSVHFDEHHVLFPNILKTCRLVNEGAQLQRLKVAFEVEILKCESIPRQDLVIDEFISRFSEKYFPETLSRNFKDMFLNQRCCDMMVKFGGKQCSVHKIVLEARSPVFAKMFEHEMLESLNNEVNIPDVDPDVFQDILLYIYSGELEKMTPDNLCEYYKIADKYELAELKEVSLGFMKSHVSQTNIYDYFLLADLYSEVKLKEVAENFIINNITHILKDEKWTEFKREHQNLSFEILEKVIWKKC